MTKKKTRRSHQSIGRLSRRKGADWERQVAKDLRPIFGEHVKRGLAQSRFGRGEAPDVDGCAPFWIETKHGKQTNPRAALQQAEDGMSAAARDGDRWPVAVCKDNQPRPGVPARPFVVMRYDTFLELLEEWWQRRTTNCEPSKALGPKPPLHPAMEQMWRGLPGEDDPKPPSSGEQSTRPDVTAGSAPDSDGG